jgi:subtilisin family serine protease
MSLGAPTRIGDLPNDDYEQIGKVCLDSGTLVVAAAGNESARPRKIAPVGSPANASTIMAVAAVDRDMKPAYFSCGGLNSGQDVDLAAPGTDVLSTVPGGGYERMDGTSMATPHVAGVAALVAESDPQYRGWALWGRVLQLTKRLNRPARDVGKGLAQAPK